MSNQPLWLKSFVDTVCQGIERLSAETPVGCHHFHDGENWEISVFAAATEVVGGPQDGQLIQEPVVYNINRIINAFDEILGITWQAGRLGSQDEIGTHLSIQGRVSGRHVWLRLLDRSPEQFSPGRILNHGTGTVVAGW